MGQPSVFDLTDSRFFDIIRLSIKQINGKNLNEKVVEEKHALCYS